MKTADELFWEEIDRKAAKRKKIEALRKAREDAGADLRAQARIKPAKVRPSRAKLKPSPVKPAGCVSLPVPHEMYSTDGVRLFNRDGRELKPHITQKGMVCAKLYLRGGYDASTNKRTYRFYPLAKTYEEQRAKLP